MSERTLGIIGGSGIYDLPELQDRKEVIVETPFGMPSDALITGTLHGVRMAFLPRHGRGHRIAPNELPFRANLHAMKQLGMDCVLGISAVGSLKAELVPGHFVLVDQFLDRTRGRTEESTFFGDVPLHRQMTVGTPVMDHVAFADTVLNSPSMASIVIHADNDVMDKHRRRHNEIDLVTRIKGV